MHSAGSSYLICLGIVLEDCLGGCCIGGRAWSNLRPLHSVLWPGCLRRRTWLIEASQQTDFSQGEVVLLGDGLESCRA
ncbi:hypothetical protein K456DRAFT_48970 [Colletotrichum gloeosporioides 23]|nr:hypothetical protein K456DRAFT_48970 [Colletotrichum gloeosporioides 23]